MRGPFNPFEGVSGTIHRVTVPWDVVESDYEEEALHTLARFRRAHPEHGRLPKESLTWGYAWSEVPVLLDLDRSVVDRVELRVEAIRLTVAYCRVGEGTETYSRDFPAPPDFVSNLLLEEEMARKEDTEG